jgi:mRNA-degrading endonuclease RelE of RelBE toxin-antitoxin system
VSDVRCALRFANAARGDLKRLDAPARERILTALDGLTADPPHGDLKRLVGNNLPEWPVLPGLE